MTLNRPIEICYSIVVLTCAWTCLNAVLFMISIKFLGVPLVTYPSRPQGRFVAKRWEDLVSSREGLSHGGPLKDTNEDED